MPCMLFTSDASVRSLYGISLVRQDNRVMRRRIQACFFMLLLCSLFVLGYFGNFFFLMKKPSKMVPSIPLRQDLIREFGEGSCSPVLNAADEIRQNGVDTIILTELTGETERIVRKSSKPNKLKIFKDRDQLMYYDRLLTSTPWKPNQRNLAEFRKKLMNHTKLNFQEEIVLTHHNVKVGDRLPYFKDNLKPKFLGKHIFHNISKKFFAEDISPISPLSGKRFKRCSVVGNGGILSNSKCGKEIDQSDYIIRSNLPIIRPYAEDAGGKTNLTTINPSLVKRRFNSLKNRNDTVEFVKAISDFYGVLWLPCVVTKDMSDLCFKIKHTLENYGIRNPEPIIANPYLYMALMDFWGERSITKILSTGFYMTHLALTMCEETHLYGFWPFPYSVPDTGTNTMRKVKYHYFDEIEIGTAHLMNDEFSALLQMHVLGVLNVHVRDCDV